VPWLAWIPDFQSKRLPHLFPAKVRELGDANCNRLVQESDHVVVSSADAYADLMRWFPAARGKASIFRFAAAPLPEWYQKDPENVTSSYGLPAKFLIFPSQFWTHKNHAVAFEAVRLLRRKGHEDVYLVSTGYTHDFRAPGHFSKLQDWIQEHDLEAHIRILGFLSRLEQLALLRRASAMVQPSLFEGWSALIEDSMALRKRLYVSYFPVHREQDPPNAVWFSPHDAEDLADRLAEDWSSLECGPQHQLEHDARLRQDSRCRAAARCFLEIVSKSTGVATLCFAVSCNESSSRSTSSKLRPVLIG
jgi:glycosyltransferase involved in cell wall biosynthesis